MIPDKQGRYINQEFFHDFYGVYVELQENGEILSLDETQNMLNLAAATHDPKDKTASVTRTLEGFGLQLQVVPVISGTNCVN